MTINSYKDLFVWQKSISLCKSIYTLTDTFPSTEKFNLISQSRRSSVSIAANIAEGYARNSTKDYIRFLNIAHGSLVETETLLIIAEECGLVVPVNLFRDIITIQKMLVSLIKKLQ